jgi:1-acyl-sn-glycerol-3-phosphate acyltransferase
MTGMNTVEGMPRKEFFAVENFEAVYTHTQETWQDPERAERYHSLLSKVLKPQVHFGPGVEDRLDQELENGAQAAIAFTHGSMFDPVHIAAMAWRNRVFAPLVGKTMIGAKVPLFTVPVIGAIVPDLGAIPVYRKKDVLNDEQTPEEQERLEALRHQAGKAFIRTETAGMNSGLHMAKHVEGTRNKEHPMEILEVRSGYGNVVCAVEPDVDILMMTAAFYYGQGSDKTRRHPTMYVDIPQNQRRSEPEEVKRIITPALQNTLDQAVSLHTS